MNAFLEFAEKQTPASVKARQRAAEKRRTTAAEKALAERDDLFHLWKRWRHERLETLLAGPPGGGAPAPVAFLQRVTPDDGGPVVELVFAPGWGGTPAPPQLHIPSLINTR